MNTDGDFQVYPDSLNEIQPRKDKDVVNRESDGVDEDRRAGPTWEAEMDLDDVDMISSEKPTVNSSVQVDDEEETAKSVQSTRCCGPDEPQKVGGEEPDRVGPLPGLFRRHRLDMLALLGLDPPRSVSGL